MAKARFRPLRRAATNSNIPTVIVPPHATEPTLLPFEPIASRELTVFGATVEAVLVPGRRGRGGIANGTRPPFARARAESIVANEAFWRGDGLALTPNRFPFAHDQRMLWPDEPVREPTMAMWQAVCAWCEGENGGGGGSAMVNTIGAASSIARAHAHLTPERRGFLPGLAVEAGPRDLIDLPDGVELFAAKVPFSLLVVRGGTTAARGAVIATLAESRMTPSWNVVVEDGTAWLYPRTIETPTQAFPYALGAAELWGRWCYVEDEPFQAVTGEGLEKALAEVGVPNPLHR